jgi:Mg-chelatase subunit ChlI
LSLTNASTIYEQEKVNLWTEKVRLASDLKNLNMLSTDWAYQNVFGMSQDEVDVERAKLVLDLKQRFRYTSIEQQGQDPTEMEKTPQNVEEEIARLKTEIEGNKGGRPREGNTYGKDKHPYGRDPLGNKENESERKRENRNLAASKKSLAREYINGISSKKKVLIEKSDLLDEKNLLDDTKF